MSALFYWGNDMANKKEILVKARALSAFAIEEANYKPGDVSEFKTDVADYLAASGLIDTSAEAVAYAEKVRDK